MKERGMLFSKPMVLALLDGSKTQTRRIVKPQPMIDAQGNFCWNGWNFGQTFEGPRIQAIASPLPGSLTKKVHCPYGRPGDRLWVRETWQGFRQTNYEYDEWEEMTSTKDWPLENWVPVYEADNKSFPDKWFPSIHMPRGASRIDLGITGVRVERLQDISEADAIAEGVNQAIKDMVGDPPDSGYESALILNPRLAYETLWESINGPGSWDANPWIWVIEFQRVKP